MCIIRRVFVDEQSRLVKVFDTMVMNNEYWAYEVNDFIINRVNAAGLANLHVKMFETAVIVKFVLHAWICWALEVWTWCSTSWINFHIKVASHYRNYTCITKSCIRRCYRQKCFSFYIMQTKLNIWSVVSLCESQVMISLVAKGGISCWNIVLKSHNLPS